MASVLSFYLSYLLLLSLSVCVLVCVCVWSSVWRGGFAWDGSALQFNWHPVLMVSGLLLLYGNGEIKEKYIDSHSHSHFCFSLLLHSL